MIERAKIYASNHNLSLSRIIESYLQSLISQPGTENDNEREEISAFVKNLTACVNLPFDLDVKREYFACLTKKYK